MKCLYIILTITLLASVIIVEAKPKKATSKFEGDFEFVDEVSAKKFNCVILCITLIYVRDHKVVWMRRDDIKY